MAGRYDYDSFCLPVYLDWVLQSIHAVEQAVFSMSFGKVRRQVQFFDEDVRDYRGKASVDVELNLGEVFESNNELFNFLEGED